MYYDYRYNIKLKKYTRSLRKNQTDTERLVWSKLRNKQLKGLKFYRQYAIDNYIIDFYCPEKKLGIELDGSQHMEQIEYDQKRSNDLQKHGIIIIRFLDNDVLKNINGVLETIDKELTIL